MFVLHQDTVKLGLFPDLPLPFQKQCIVTSDHREERERAPESLLSIVDRLDQEFD